MIMTGKVTIKQQLDVSLVLLSTHFKIRKSDSLNVKVILTWGIILLRFEALHSVCTARCFCFQPLGIKT